MAIHNQQERDVNRYRELDRHHRKHWVLVLCLSQISVDQHSGEQWVMVPFPFPDQCEHFSTIF